MSEITKEEGDNAYEQYLVERELEKNPPERNYTEVLQE